MESSDIAKNLYVFYATLPDEIQQAFLQELQNSSLNESNNSQENVTENNGRTKEQQERAIKIYDAYRDDLRKRQLSNNENYDKTVLTLSSSGLALSLTAIKFALTSPIKCIVLLQGSWWLFGLTICISIIAYWISNKGLDKQLEMAEAYYAKGIEDAFSAKNWYAIINDWLNIVAGVIFLIATALIIAFVTFKLIRIIQMSDKEKYVGFQLGSANVPKMQCITYGQKVGGSAGIPPMQLAPSQTSVKPRTTQNTNSNNKNKE